MVNLDYLILAVPISYKYNSNKNQTISKDYEKTVAIVDAIYSHNRLEMPYDLIVIGY
jgi:hypothetical protein